MDRKEQAIQKIVTIIQNTLDYTVAKTEQFEGFFYEYLERNDFDNSAMAKKTIGNLEDFQGVMRAALADPNKANIERFIEVSAAFALYCEQMAE